jgi:hypothetical protein
MQKQKIKFYILLPVLALAILALAGCGKSISQRASEKAAEKIIEKQSGGKANVDIDGKNLNIETEQGKMQAGENVELPADFPADVYVIDGTIKVAISGQVNEGQSVSIETDKNVGEVSNTYLEKLASDGWKITGTMNFGESTSIIAEKDNRTVSVSIARSDNKTTVTVIVAKK